MAESFDDIAGYRACLTFEEALLQALDAVHGHSTRKDSPAGSLNDSVCQAGPEELVGELDCTKAVIDEKIAAHGFVNKVLLD